MLHSCYTPRYNPLQNLHLQIYNQDTNTHHTPVPIPEPMFCLHFWCEPISMDVDATFPSIRLPKGRSFIPPEMPGSPRYTDMKVGRSSGTLEKPQHQETYMGNIG